MFVQSQTLQIRVTFIAHSFFWYIYQGATERRYTFMHIFSASVYTAPLHLGINWSSWMLMEKEKMEILFSVLPSAKDSDQTMSEPNGICIVLTAVSSSGKYPTEYHAFKKYRIVSQPGAKYPEWTRKPAGHSVYVNEWQTETGKTGLKRSEGKRQQQMDLRLKTGETVTANCGFVLFFSDSLPRACRSSSSDPNFDLVTSACCSDTPTLSE